MLTEPVAETSGIRLSSASFWPTLLRSPSSKVKIAGSAPVSRQTRSAIFVTAIALSGVFSDAFQTVASPQTAASAAFHVQFSHTYLPLLFGPFGAEIISGSVLAVRWCTARDLPACYAESWEIAITRLSRIELDLEKRILAASLRKSGPTRVCARISWAPQILLRRE